MDIAQKLIEPFSHKPAVGFKVNSMEEFEATCHLAYDELMRLSELVGQLTHEINAYKDAIAQIEGE